MARYHPIYEGLWDDAQLEGLSFECHGFFAFLCSNKRCRPSGIYRATDGQLAEDAGLPAGRVRGYLSALAERHRIVRDGAWLFVCSYLQRQPHHERLMKAVVADLNECTSEAIKTAFCQKYPLLSKPMQALGFKMVEQYSVLSTQSSVFSSQPKPPLSPSETSPPPGDLSFADFWAAYPSKTGKGAAEEAWGKLVLGIGKHAGKPRPTMAEILTAIERQGQSRRWQDGIIPNPATWITQRRWQDEVPPAPRGTPKTHGNVEALRRFVEHGQEPSA